MTVYADSVSFAQKLLPAATSWKEIGVSSVPSQLRTFLDALVCRDVLYRADAGPLGSWGTAVLVESAAESQFDALNRLCRLHDAPSDGLVCAAGTGKSFHGFKNRPWEAASGNLHLSILTAPRTAIAHVGVAFVVLAVVAVLEALDDLRCPEHRPSVKWVNDILVQGAKIGGVLANCQIQDDVVTHATLGIGLNVETVPTVPRSPVVPAVGSLHQFCAEPRRCRLDLVFQKLMMYLATNYAELLSGNYGRLLDCYRSRSVVLGSRVRVHRDQGEGTSAPIFEGTVRSIGEDLELFFDSVPTPVTEGRLELLTS